MLKNHERGGKGMIKNIQGYRYCTVGEEKNTYDVKSPNVRGNNATL